MATIFYPETPWDTSPDSTSVFEIYDPEDQYILANATDAIQKYDGDKFRDLDGGPPNGNILAVYKDRLIVAGDPTYKHRIWFSHVRNGEGWSKDVDWLDIRPDDGGKINGLAIAGDELVISKDNGRLYGWKIYEDGRPENSTVRQLEDDKGAVNQKAITVLDDVAYYLDRDRIDSVPTIGRGGASFIVDELIKGIQSFTGRAMGSNDGKVYIALGDIDIEVGDTVTIEDAVLVLDTVNGGYYLRDHVCAQVFSKFIDSDSAEELYFGDNNGKVFKLDSGTMAGSSPIYMRVRTKPFFRELGSFIQVNKIGIYMDNPDGTVVNYRTSLNRDFSRNVGTVKEEPVQWFDVDIKGRLLQLEFSHSNSIVRPRILRIDIDYEEEGQDA